MSAPAAGPPQTKVVLGRVVGAHALRGEVRVQVLGDSPENLLGCETVWLARDAAGRELQRYEVERSGTGRPHEVRLALAGVHDRDAAEALRGRLVLGEAADLAPLPEGEYYWHELIGCLVESTAGERIGHVSEIWETGGHDVLVIEFGPEGRRVLVPTAREIMKSVDLEARLILVEALPGLFGDGSEGS